MKRTYSWDFSPSIYVVIPVYNVEPYIRECFDSLTAQTFANVSYVVVDDGSTDGSSQICDQYAQIDPRFTIIHIENGGVSNARNTAIEHILKISAAGDYITFVDPDDYYITDEAISVLADKIKNNPADLHIFNHLTNNALSASAIMNGEGGVFTRNEIGSKIIPALFFGHKYNGSRLTASLFRASFSVALIKKHCIRFRKDIHKAEDTLFYAHYLIHAKTVALTDVALYNYRIRSNSLTTTKSEPQIEGLRKGFSIIEELEDCISEIEGVEKTLSDNYFAQRYIGAFFNYIKILCDSGFHLPILKICSEIDKMYAFVPLIRRIESLHDISIQLNFKKRLIIGKHRLTMITYAKVYHFLKRIKSKTI